MWQPIETAPKDRFLLLCGPSGYIIIPWVFVTGCMYSDYHVGRWVDHANDDLSDWGFEPTHWMPLPEAPDAQAQRAPSIKDAIIDDIQSQFDSEGITEHDSGDALIRLSDAIAAVEDNFVQIAPSVPDWLPVPDKHPTFDPVDLQLADGSVLCGCVPQSDGDYWWEGPSGEVFIDPRYAPVTHWRLSAAPEARQ